MILPNKLFDILKWICMICLPAVATFLATVLSLVNVDPAIVAIIIGIITATDTLLGSLLGISNNIYNKRVGADDDDLSN